MTKLQICSNKLGEKGPKINQLKVNANLLRRQSHLITRDLHHIHTREKKVTIDKNTLSRKKNLNQLSPQLVGNRPEREKKGTAVPSRNEEKDLYQIC